MAGHSLGELAALVAAGVLSPEEGLRVVVVRGQAMHAAAERAAQPGGMLAVETGLAGGNELASRYGLTLANDNAPRQVVLAGPRRRLMEARADSPARGLRSAMLPINGALHSSAMRPAASDLEQALASVSLRPAQRRVLSGVTARPFDDVRLQLVQAVTSMVRWRETVLHLSELGVTRFVEVGPGDVLTGLIRRTLTAVDASPAAAVELSRG